MTTEPASLRERVAMEDAAYDFADGMFPAHAGFDASLRLAAIAGYLKGSRVAREAAAKAVEDWAKVSFPAPEEEAAALASAIRDDKT